MVHQFKNNGYNIVLDVNTSSVHVVDDLVYDILEMYRKEDNSAIVEKMVAKYSDSTLVEQLGYEVNEETVLEAIGEIDELVEEGVLFTEESYKPKVMEFKARPTVIKAMCLHVAHDCNLACKYCFAEEGEYKGRRAIMSYEVGKAAFDFLVAHSGNRRNLEVDFFGGEPLMNWDVVKKLVAYGRELEKTHDKKFRFTVTTNGVLLDQEKMDFINAEMHNVVLSLDGRREVNDRMRPFRGGQGSYDFITPKHLAMAKSRGGKSYYVRGTFTRYNLDFCEDILHFADLGFDEISIEPVVAPETEDYALRPEDLPKIFEQYDKLAAEMVRRKKEEGKCFTFFHFMIDLSGGPCVYKRAAGCGSGTEYVAVTPWGDIYPCHQFVGEEEWLLGNVFDGIKRDDIVQKFKSINVYTKEECQDCFAKFFCSGGCAANAYHFTGDIGGVYGLGCEMQRKRVECALMIKAAEGDLAEAAASCDEDCEDDCPATMR
ncbi:MAG: thioether cross-link-forming SCIFF peptide maturase [Lachnospiraceae bacterium]|nr:thioether cross-link-forming SCIFF peptide maturase [Lachnospiraceae bacterium]